MAKFPNPPPVAQLSQLTPQIRQLPVGTMLWRVYFQGGRYPGQWDGYRDVGPTTARFDHQLPAKGPPRLQKRAIHYAALDAVTALAEVFQATRTIDRGAKSPWLVGYATTAPLDLLDLHSPFATRIGASMAISAGPRSRARAWSRAFYGAYPRIHGLYYGSSMHAFKPVVALYERVRNVTASSPPGFHRALSDPTIFVPLRHAAGTLGYGLI